MIASDSEGVTLELVTKQFDVTPVAVGAERFERLRVAEYVHGYTRSRGCRSCRSRGILIDLPEGKQGRVTVLETAQPGAFRLPGVSGADL